VQPTTWVAIAFFAFIALLGKKLWLVMVNALDARSAKIAEDLREAEALRKEAESTLEAYKKRQREAMQEVEQVLAQARTDAEYLRKQAHTELQTTIEQRTKQTLELIAQEEQKTLQDVREHVVALCLAAAKLVITEQLDKEANDPWVDAAIDDIPRILH
jgi:F-type H+-transporting ATPase subunit b